MLSNKIGRAEDFGNWLQGWCRRVRDKNKVPSEYHIKFVKRDNIGRMQKDIECRKIKYTDEQVKQVRQYLYLLAEMQIEIDKNK